MNSDLITTRKTHQFSSRQLIVGFEEIKLSTEELRKKAEAMLKAIDNHETRERQMSRSISRIDSLE